MERLSLNQITVRQWSLAEAVEGCARHGVGAIGLWRDKVAEVGVDEAAALVRRAGLRVSSLCRGGFFTGRGPDGPTGDGVAGTRAALEEAARLGAEVLVLVVGGVAGTDLAGARRRVAEGLEQVVPDALRLGVRLGLEPLHPVTCADRSVLVTLDQALALAAPYPVEAVGVVVDEYHVWWDPRVEDAIAAAGARICGFHACDTLVPLPDPLLGRALPGDGPIDHRRLRACADAAGYAGPIEVEVFNADLWALPGDEALTRTVHAYLDHVA